MVYQITAIAPKDTLNISVDRVDLLLLFLQSYKS